MYIYKKKRAECAESACYSAVKAFNENVNEFKRSLSEASIIKQYLCKVILLIFHINEKAE